MKTKLPLLKVFQYLVYDVVVRWIRKDTMKLCNDKDGAEPVVFGRLRPEAVLPPIPSKTQ